jgi:D-sedoheptulose 7-phosphate isomerase
MLQTDTFDDQLQPIVDDIVQNRPEERVFLEQMLRTDSRLQTILPAMLRVFDLLVTRFTRGRSLFLCGNGGSCADCMHIAGELMKSFNRRRLLSAAQKAAFADHEFGDILAEHLEAGLRCIPLGFNHALNSAILNDSGLSDIQYAQELYVLGRPEDVLLGISTSGNARNVLFAVSTAKALGMTTVGLTGYTGGKLAQAADLTINVPETATPHVQEQHITVYHTLCAMLESRFFGQAQ